MKNCKTCKFYMDCHDSFRKLNLRTILKNLFPDSVKKCGNEILEIIAKYCAKYKRK